jgi:CPA1 family monovalent cation:H+ antiporter
MPEGSLVIPVIGVLQLLLLASLSAVVLRRIRFPYTIGLVVIGIVVGVAQDRLAILEPIRHIELTPDIVLYLFLPTLVFPVAVQLDLGLLRQYLFPVILLAFPGLLLSTVIVGSALGAVTPLAPMAALLFGALISATDPVAVVGLFKDLHVPERLSVLVDGESLFNDATAIVLFGILLSAMTADAATGLPVLLHGATAFLLVSLGGLGTGAVIAVIYAQVTRAAEDDPLVEIALSMVLAYTSFVVAHHYLHVSGIMAVVAAGLVGGRLRRKDLAATPTRAYLQHYWDYAVFVANSFVFLFLGIRGNTFLTRMLSQSAINLSYIAYAIVVVTVARLIVVYGVFSLPSRRSNATPIRRPDQAIIFWGGGLRGALPLVLALSLPLQFPQRALILDLTAGVVLFTLLVQGTTVGRLIRSVEPT